MAGAFRTGADILSVERHHQLRSPHSAVRVSGVHGASQTVDQFQVFCFPAVRKIPGEPHAVKPLSEGRAGGTSR